MPPSGASWPAGRSARGGWSCRRPWWWPSAGGLRPGRRPSGSACGHRRPAHPRPARGWWPRHRPAPRPVGTASPPTTPAGSTSAAPDTPSAAAPTHGRPDGNGWSRGPPCAAAACRPPPPPGSHRRRGGTGRTGTAPPAPAPHRPAGKRSPPPGNGGFSAAARQNKGWRSETPAASPPRRTTIPAAAPCAGSERWTYG